MNKIRWSPKYASHLCKDGSKGNVYYRLEAEGIERHKCDRCEEKYIANSPTMISA